MGPLQPPLTTGVQPCQTRQTDFAYVKMTTHRSRLSYTPTAVSATAWGWGWVSSKALGSSRAHNRARGGPDTRAGAGTSRAGGCRGPESPWCLPVQCGGGVGDGTGRDRTPLCPGPRASAGALGCQQHPCSSSSQRASPAHTAHGRASAQLPAPQLRAVTAAQAPGEHQGRESLESAGRGTGSTPPPSPGQGSRCCGIAVPQHPTPLRLPPTLCPLQTITLHLRKLGPRPPEAGGTEAAARWGCPGPSWRGVAEGQRHGRQPRVLLEVGRRASGEESVLVASLFSQRLHGEAGAEQRAFAGHRRVQPNSAQGQRHSGVRRPPWHSHPPAQPGAASCGAGAGGGAGPAGEGW